VYSNKLPCVLPWKALFMDERENELSAVPCCANWIRQSYGRMDTNTTMNDIWNGPGAQEIRRLLIEGRQDELCDPDCPWLASGRFSENDLNILPGTSAFEENQYLNNKEISQRRLVLESFPMAIRIIPTLHCNIRCRMCHQDHQAEINLPEAFMSDVRGIGPYIYDYQLHGGEVIISHRFREWADPGWFDANPQILLSLVTNATYIPEKSWEILKRVRINYITVSINAATGETYSYITGADLFNNVLQNIISLRNLALRHVLRKFKIYLSFVIMKCNYHELPDFIQLANELQLPVHLLLVVGNEAGESIYTDPPILKDVLDTVQRSELLSASEEDRLEILRVQQSLKSSIAALNTGGISCIT